MTMSIGRRSWLWFVGVLVCGAALWSFLERDRLVRAAGFALIGLAFLATAAGLLERDGGRGRLAAQVAVLLAVLTGLALILADHVLRLWTLLT